MQWYLRIIALVIGYGFGNIESGYLFGKAMHVDLRKEGSGNIGSTNALRTLGNKMGFLTLLCDCGKGMLASLVVWLLFRGMTGPAVRVLILYALFGAILGHNFPAVMGFKGGKGVATSLGFAIVGFPHCLPITAVVFIGTVFLTRYVSLGSILAAFSVPLQCLLFMRLGWLMFPQEYWLEVQVLAWLMALLVLVRHRENIGRLRAGTERKFAFHKKEDKKEGR